jgi:methylmalonyl-CoA/ethylmalonyl-CoA epimerase
MLSRPEQDAATHSSILNYKTADIHATAADLESRGVTLEGKPHMLAKLPDHELWMAFFRDTEGNLLGLMSEVR